MCVSDTHLNDVDNNPITLANPHNHCHLNYVLQVVFRFQDILFQHVLINNNSKGHIVNYSLHSLQSGSEAEMAKLKSNLSMYSRFFDGVVQRDAYECF